MLCSRPVDCRFTLPVAALQLEKGDLLRPYKLWMDNRAIFELIEKIATKGPNKK